MSVTIADDDFAVEYITRAVLTKTLLELHRLEPEHIKSLVISKLPEQPFFPAAQQKQNGKPAASEEYFQEPEAVILCFCSTIIYFL